MVKILKTIPVNDEVAFLSKGIKALRYSTVTKLLRVFKNPQLGAELGEYLDKGPVYIVKYDKYTVVLLPDHSHIIEAKNVAEAEKVIEDLSKIISK
ncbi:MAG: hypothetical protein QW607_04980 [Desulfurococcaceae archaeon]